MKLAKLLLTALFIFNSAIVLASTTFNGHGFPTCTTMHEKIYFFDWDSISKAQFKKISYFELNSYVTATGHYLRDCEDAKFIKEIPADIKIELNFNLNLFPQQIRFALEQLQNGATHFYPETSPELFIAAHAEFFQPDSPEKITQLRRELGDKRATRIIDVWTNQLFSSLQDCRSLVGTCDFYLCQESKNPCGLDGYNMGFGLKYCSSSKFSLLPKMSTALGKSWVPQVFTCLQEKNYQASQIASSDRCQTIEQESIKTHAFCYAAAGFCQLKISEKVKIFNLIKNEIISKNAISQTLELTNRCGVEK